MSVAAHRPRSSIHSKVFTHISPDSTTSTTDDSMSGVPSLFASSTSKKKKRLSIKDQIKKNVAASANRPKPTGAISKQVETFTLKPKKKLETQEPTMILKHGEEKKEADTTKTPWAKKQQELKHRADPMEEKRQREAAAAAKKAAEEKAEMERLAKAEQDAQRKAEQERARLMAEEDRLEREKAQEEERKAFEKAAEQERLARQEEQKEKEEEERQAKADAERRSKLKTQEQLDEEKRKHMEWVEKFTRESEDAQVDLTEEYLRDRAARRAERRESLAEKQAEREERRRALEQKLKDNAAVSTGETLFDTNSVFTPEYREHMDKSEKRHEEQRQRDLDQKKAHEAKYGPLYERMDQRNMEAEDIAKAQEERAALIKAEKEHAKMELERKKAEQQRKKEEYEKRKAARRANSASPPPLHKM